MKRVEKVCVVCGNDFVDRSNRQIGKYCTKTCRSRASLRNQLEKYPEYYKDYYEDNKEKFKEHNHKYREENREKLREYAAYYGKKYAEKIARTNKLRAQKHPEKGRENASRYRARLKNAFVEKIDYKEIYIRDNYVCQICGEPVKMNEKYPHPLSSSIDHIIPLAKGGTHERKNVQLSHLTCNLHKQAKIKF